MYIFWDKDTVTEFAIFFAIASLALFIYVFIKLWKHRNDPPNPFCGGPFD